MPRHVTYLIGYGPLSGPKGIASCAELNTITTTTTTTTTTTHQYSCAWNWLSESPLAGSSTDMDYEKEGYRAINEKANEP